METLVSGRKYKDGGHFHDAKQHGLAWVAINELLHVIVFVHTLYGMIQFRVKFIRMIRLVKWVSKLIIAYSWYLSVKFALIAALMYFYHMKLEQQSIGLADLNCSLASYRLVLDARQAVANKTAALGGAAKVGAGTSNVTAGLLLTQLPEYLFNLDYQPLITRLLDTFGGPFRLLGNRATLLYGVYSISIYIMLAIFPLELMYFIDVGFNFIRFVLSDPGCMKDLYDRRRRHLSRLSSWSRLQADSILTQGAKMILNQRDLRSNYADDYNQLASYLFRSDRSQRHLRLMSASRPQRDHQLSLQFQPAPNHRRGSSGIAEQLIGGDGGCSGGDDDDDGPRPSSFESAKGPGPRRRQLYLPTIKSLDDGKPAAANKRQRSRCIRMAQVAQLERKLSTNVKQLKTRLAINHLSRPSYKVVVAYRNLDKFKPFVRSDVWFKASMVIYTIFVFFYLTSHLFMIGLIERYFESFLSETLASCTSGSMRSHDEQLSPHWSLMDKLMLYEGNYTVFILSCASSFYCSYYFGTIIELTIWVREISQQLELSAHVVELTDVLTHSSRFSPMQAHQLLVDSFDLKTINLYVNDFGGLSELFPALQERRQQWRLAGTTAAGSRREHGLDDTGARAAALRTKSKLKELMAIKLLTKKETLQRATYVNMCLFFDELHETRFMTTTILRRTTQLASGFAFMASITRSQFKANYSRLNWLLGGTLLVFNLYLACAAHINSGVNKMLVHIHSLICASLRTSSEDADLFEFWLRHVGSFGEDRDVSAYKIYGYKVTWSTIINVSRLPTSRRPKLTSGGGGKLTSSKPITELLAHRSTVSYSRFTS